MVTKVPYVNLAAQHRPIKDKLLAAIGAVIDEGQFILADQVVEFERRFAELCGAKFALGVNSGTDALILALTALGVGPGDEVITVPNSFVASASCIALVGARPVFVDVGADYNLDPSLLEAAITPKTKAILPVHLTGRPADMDAISAVAQAHGLYIVEDAAQAVCAEYKGRRVGSLSTIGCFSLHPLKTLNACGDAGALTTNDASLYEELKRLRNHGLKTRDECVRWGYNSRLDTLQAAILLVKLDYVEQWTERRRANAARYQQLLAGLEQVVVPVDKPYELAVYHTFVIRTEQREQVRTYLADSGIGTSVHYPIPIHLQEAAADLGYGLGSFPVSEQQAGEIISLPLYPELQLDEIDFVAETLRSFFS